MKNWMPLLVFCGLVFSVQAQENASLSEVTYSTWIPKNGKLEQAQHFSFQTYTERFNEAGDLIETVYFSKGEPQQIKQYHYLDGRLEKTESEDQTGRLLMVTQYTYDSKGRIQEEVIQNLVSNKELRLRYAYSENGLTKTLYDPEGQVDEVLQTTYLPNGERVERIREGKVVEITTVQKKGELETEKTVEHPLKERTKSYAYRYNYGEEASTWTEKEVWVDSDLKQVIRRK